jgi:hypothetical protein
VSHSACLFFRLQLKHESRVRCFIRKLIRPRLVSLRQNGVGPSKTCADAILPKGRGNPASPGENSAFGSNLLPILLFIRLSLSFDLLFQFFDFPAHLFDFFQVQRDLLLRIAINERIVGWRLEKLGVRLRAGDIGDAIG